jgi:tRNA-Thr(GGU) m(6)t(6)A37 methyltransferase TsaA
MISTDLVQYTMVPLTSLFHHTRSGLLTALMSIQFEPVATIRSCYTQRFGIPRQAGLAPSAQATIVFDNNDNNLLSIRGLEAFSHLWVIFLFHKQHYATAKPLVQPPRLGGKKSVGVFATRSPNRPNPVGLSCVALHEIEQTESELRLHISGGDFLDETPVIDIKPYVAFADAIDNATSAWAEPITTRLPVQWNFAAQESLLNLCNEDNQPAPATRRVIEETIALDPRPGYERNKDGKENQQWHMRIYDYDISFGVSDGTAHIQRVIRYSNPGQ